MVYNVGRLEGKLTFLLWFFSWCRSPRNTLVEDKAHPTIERWGNSVVRKCAGTGERILWSNSPNLGNFLPVWQKLVDNSVSWERGESGSNRGGFCILVKLKPAARLDNVSKQTLPN